MRTPFVLLKWLARAVLRDERLRDGSLTEMLPDVVREVWPRWAGGSSEEQLRGRLQALVRAPDIILAQHVERLAERAARGLPDAERDALARYLTLVPAAIRTGLRRPADPSGTTVPAH